MAAIVLMVSDHRYDRLQPVKDGIAFILYPVELVATAPFDFASWVSTTFRSHTTLLGENRKLQDLNQRLQGQMLRYKALIEENSHLREQLGATLRVGERVTLAEMTDVDLSPYRQQIGIDKGSQAGVFVGQPVVDAHAIMGQVINTTPFRATILLITDPLHSIPVRVLRTGLRTIANGTGRIDNLELPYLPASADLRIGDLLVSSGLGGRYPADYPVARITSVGTDNSGATLVQATPLARLAEDKEVMLVWSLDEQLQSAPIAEVPPEAEEEP